MINYFKPPVNSLQNRKMLVCSLLIIFLILPLWAYPQNKKNKRWSSEPEKFIFNKYGEKEIQLTSEEFRLYDLLMQYRAEHGLTKIPLSKSLTYVARTHAGDLTENYRRSKKCNIHSWSKKGWWSPCCYESNHSKADCMWDKPRELTNYLGDGFEIAYWNLWSPSADSTFAHWTNSELHDPVILNTGTWEKVKWEAIGIGIFDDYALVWFGKRKDPDGPPLLPSECQ